MPTRQRDPEATAGLAWAADRHTVILMAHPESEEGCKLIYTFSELSSEALSGILNVKVIGASDWVAGAADDFMVEFLAKGVRQRTEASGLTCRSSSAASRFQ